MRPVAFLFILLARRGAQDAVPPVFEVASVEGRGGRPPAMGPGMGPVRIARGCGKPDPAMVRCTNTPLKQLIVRAYAREELSGGRTRLDGLRRVRRYGQSARRRSRR